MPAPEPFLSSERSSGQLPADVTAVVLTFNDEMHVGRCLERLLPVAKRVVVIDSFSSDNTVEIARRAGADVLEHRFSTHAAQYNWAYENSGIETEWVLTVDADEFLEAPLIAEIKARLSQLPPRITAVEVKRKIIFQGKWIRWGGHYDPVFIRLWRQGAARMEQRWMDQQVVLQRGGSVRFRAGDLVDENLKDIAAWTDKHNLYTTRQMIDFIMLEHNLVPCVAENVGGLTRSARIKRQVRNRLYRRMPLYLRAVLYYLYRYVLRLGFLDGRQGFIFHTLQGFWNFLLVDVKVGEARRFIRREGMESFKADMRRRHGLDLDRAPCSGQEQ